MRRTLLLATLFALVVALSAPIPPAHALATVTSSKLFCDGFEVSGTTNARYVTLWVVNSKYDLISKTTILGSGDFSATVSFPAQPEGTLLYFQVWGAKDPNAHLFAPGYWDLEAWFNDSANCTLRTADS